MPMYVNSDRVSIPVDRVYVGENLVYKKEYKYEEITIDSSNSKAGIDSGVEYKEPAGPVCILKNTYRSTIKLRITFEAIADKWNSGDLVTQVTHHPDSTFTNGTWTKEFTFKKDSPAIGLITNDVSMRGSTRLIWSYNNKTNIVKLWLTYSNGLDEDNPNYPWLRSNVYIKVIKVEQYV